MKKYTFTEKKDTRSGFGAGMTELGQKNENVVALCADLVGSLKIAPFIKENPERFFQCGIGEANMIGVSAGLAIGGKIPFATTFANFATGRVYDQIRQSVTYSNKNVKIAASHAGITLGRRRRDAPDPGRHRHDENATRHDGHQPLRLQPNQSRHTGCS